MKDINCRIFIVDDDPSVCKSLARLLASAGHQTEIFNSAKAYLQREIFVGIGCLILDVRMPQLTGIELQRQLAERGDNLPIIFLTAHGELPMGIEAMKQGAVDFLTKPVDEIILLDAIQKALVGYQSSRNEQSQESKARAYLETLTHREMEVLQQILGGHTNYQIGTILGITEKTVKAHRGKVMQKLKANTAAELGWISAFTDIRTQKIS